MTAEKIRDPEIVLKPGRFFEDLSRYSDQSLRSSFASYNEIHPKTEIGPGIAEVQRRKSSLLSRFLKFGTGQ
jgi:hypothetical protein